MKLITLNNHNPAVEALIEIRQIREEDGKVTSLVILLFPDAIPQLIPAADDLTPDSIRATAATTWSRLANSRRTLPIGVLLVAATLWGVPVVQQLEELMRGPLLAIALLLLVAGGWGVGDWVTSGAAWERIRMAIKVPTVEDGDEGHHED